ncbi:MAG: stage V sporulation protein AD, partial [Clostridia bacterium]|nr:stage V sporulation protein AD [Clostridia bacterium]
MSRILYKGNGCDFLKNNKIARKTTGQTIFFTNPVSIIGSMSAGGVKECTGPIGDFIKQKYHDDKISSKTFEKNEFEMLHNTALGAVKSSGLRLGDIDLFLAGDLLNQITSSSFVARELGIPYLGLYSACSTMTEAFMLGAVMIDAGFCDNILCATVSHFATAERQYRYPLEYGCQRPPYAQWTVTGAGANVLSNKNSNIKIISATIGKVIDFGTNDLNNMGASMAPAAADSMMSFFRD